MDFEFDLQTKVEFIPRHTVLRDLPIRDCATCRPTQWTNQYAFLALNMENLNVAADGLNEKGLSAAWLYLTPTIYPEPLKKNVTTSDKIMVTNVCSYLLSNYASVAEVEQSFRHHAQVVEFNGELLERVLHLSGPMRFPLHVSLHDASGASLVIEMLHGHMILNPNPTGVCTNAPPLELQLDHLAAFRQSSGHDIPGGYSPIDRFIRLAQLNQQVGLPFAQFSPGTELSFERNSSNVQRALSRALHLVNTVVLPPGVNRIKVPSSSSRDKVVTSATQWSLVRDHRARVIYFQTTENQVVHKVDLGALLSVEEQRRHALDVSTSLLPFAIDITHLLSESREETQDIPDLSSSIWLRSDISTFTTSVLSSWSYFGLGWIIGIGCTLGAQVLWTKKRVEQKNLDSSIPSHYNYQSIS